MCMMGVVLVRTCSGLIGGVIDGGRLDHSSSWALVRTRRGRSNVAFVLNTCAHWKRSFFLKVYRFVDY